MNLQKIKIAGLAITTFLGAAQAANAVVIDFNANHNTGFAVFENPYSEDGFTLTNDTSGNEAGLFWGDGSGYNADLGGATFSHNYSGSTSMLVKTGGGSFSFQSIGLGDVYNNGTVIDVLFSFMFGDATTSTQTVTLDNLTGLQTFNFNLTNLLSVAWTPQNNYLQLDNIVVDETQEQPPTVSVPEPGSLALLAAGVIGLVVTRRRAKA